MGLQEEEEEEGQRLLETEGDVAKGGVLSSTFSLCNVCLGAGTLSMPHAVESVGLVLGLGILVTTAACSVAAAVLLILCSQRVQRSPELNPGVLSYTTLMQCGFGKKGVAAVQLVVVVAMLGLGTLFLQLIGDLVAPQVGYWMGDDPHSFCSFWASRHGPMLLVLGLEIPLCLLPTLHALRYTSFIALMSMLYMVVVVSLRASQSDLGSDGSDSGEEVRLFKVGGGLFNAVPVMIFSFTSHNQLVQLYAEMRNRTTLRVGMWVGLSYALCLAAYTIVGVFGYFAFRDNTNANVLLNFEPDDTAAAVASFGVAVAVTAGYPIMCTSGVQAVDHFAFPGKEHSAPNRRFGWVAAYMVVSFCIAWFVKDISIVIGFIGATGATTMTYILPSLLYLTLFPDASRLTRAGVYGLLALGTSLGLVAVVVNLYDAVTPPAADQCIWPQGCPPQQRCCPDGGVFTPNATCD